jgi:hypothetical protein
VQNPPESARRKVRNARWKLLAVLAVCAAPVIASYFTYYVIRPEGRTNYGELIAAPMPALSGLAVAGPDGTGTGLDELQGKWTMVAIEDGPCDADCEARLYALRQVRLTAGKDRDRVERLLVLTGQQAPAPQLLAEHEGLLVRRAQADAVARVFPVADGLPAEHIYVVDPLGNVMMRFPKSADPNRMKKDLAKLLRASRVG